jgi:hypothetical protein
MPYAYTQLNGNRKDLQWESHYLLLFIRLLLRVVL